MNKPSISEQSSSAVLYAVSIGLFLLTLTLFMYSRGAAHLNLIIGSDALGYFQYLPYFFIEGDVHNLPYAGPLPNGNTLNIYHIGVAILQLPFFLLSHLFAVFTDYPPTGFSEPYIYGVVVAASFYNALASFLLMKVLSIYFKPMVTIITIILLLIGTNLMYYTSFEPGMSHVYSLFLFSWFIYQVHGYLARPTFASGMFLGITLGVITVVRPSNLIIVLYLLLVDVKSLDDLKNRFILLLRNKGLLVFMSITFVVGLLPQLLYWHAVTGDFIVFSYGHAGQGFNWASPALLKVLFSPQNGWLIYSPIMLLSLIGLAMTLKRQTHNSLAIVSIMLITYYIFSSWWAWWFGAAYGHRAFVEYYALLCIPMAYTIKQIFNLDSKAIKGLLLTLGILAIYVNMKMCFLYNPPWDGADWGWDDYSNIIRAIF